MTVALYCELCGSLLDHADIYGRKYDLLTGEKIPESDDGYYHCPLYEEDFRGETNGHTSIFWDKGRVRIQT